MHACRYSYPVAVRAIELGIGNSKHSQPSYLGKEYFSNSVTASAWDVKYSQPPHCSYLGIE